LLTLFKKIIAVYTENHAEPINKICRITDSNGEVAGTFSCHSYLKGYCHQYRPEEDEFHSVSVLPGGGR
jgi:hypothetical protein